MFDLSNKTALITGAGQGVGRGIADALARQGAAVAINDLDPDRAESAANELRDSGKRAVAAPFDVTSFEKTRAGYEAAVAALGPIDILVNNAGIPAGMNVASFRDTEPEDWRKYLDLNAYGVMNCAKVAVDSMCDRGWGRIVTISSGAGQIGISLGISAYGAGKGAGISFMRHLAAEVARFGVTANTLALGMIDNHYDASVTEHLVKSIPVRRLGRPEDVGPAVVYLASEEAGWMTGQTIGLNGGSTTS